MQVIFNLAFYEKNHLNFNKLLLPVTLDTFPWPFSFFLPAVGRSTNYA